MCDARWCRDFGAPIKTNITMIDPYVSDGSQPDRQRVKFKVKGH